MIAAGAGNAIRSKDHVAVDEQLCSTVLFQMQYKVAYLMSDGNSLSNMSMCGVVGDGSPFICGNQHPRDILAKHSSLVVRFER